MKKRILITCTDSMMKQFLEPHVIHLVESGYSVDAACSEVLDRYHEVTEDLKEYANLRKLQVQRSPFSLSNLKGYREIRQLLKEQHYDLIWTNEPVMGLLTRLAARTARRHGTQVIYMAHGFHFYYGAPRKNWMIYYPIEKWMSKYTDKLITINQEDYQLASSRFSCPVFHMHGVGTNSGKFHPVTKEQQEERKRRLGLEGPVILNVGELNANKNQKTAIYALEKVLLHYPNAKLLIAGKGEDRKQLEELTAQRNLTGKVVFLGYTTELEQYTQICDVLISCSYREGLGQNVLEALLCGKPVVASHNRGHDELIAEGSNGFLANADDAETFAKRICDIFSSKQDYAEETMKSAEKYKDVNVMKELDKILNEGIAK